MSIKQVTLDGKILVHTPEDEKALLTKVKASFSKQMIHAKDNYGDIVKGKKYKAVFSSAIDSVMEILNCIEEECPEAVRAWIDKKLKGV